MASSAVCAVPEVIVIDQNGDSREILKLKSQSNILIHTGNIANWESLKSRKTQLPVNELYHSLKSTLTNWVNDVSEKKDSAMDCYRFETFESDEERELLKITVKIMLQNNETTFIEKALRTVLNTLKVKYVDTTILSLPSEGEIEEHLRIPFKEMMPPYWKEMEKLHSMNLTNTLSSCDLEQPQLEELMNFSTIKPEVNQVNLTSCCHMPEDLVAYARAVNVVLHTHGDDPVMLSNESIQKLVQEVEPSNELSWRCDWLVRYAVVVKCRGVIKSKGYIASVRSI